MPAGIIRQQFNSNTKFQDIYNLQDSRLYADKKQNHSKRLNSANKHRRRLLQRESRSPELVKNDSPPEPHEEVFQTNNLRQLADDEKNYVDVEDGDVTPKVCQLDSVRELDEDKEIREITEKVQHQSNCWSSFSWSSLYDRGTGTDSSLSWADDEYEKETTETVRRMFDNVEEMFYSSSLGQQRRKTSQHTAQEKECQMWSKNFPTLRVVGKAVKIQKQKRENEFRTVLSVTGKQSSVLGRNGSLQRIKNQQKNTKLKQDNFVQATDTEDTAVEEVFAQHGDYEDHMKEERVLSQKFETEPSKYFEDKIFSALFDKLLLRNVILETNSKYNRIKFILYVSSELQPAITSYQDKIVSGEKLDPVWEEAVSNMKTRNPFTHRDSLEEDSIFSLGKIIASPRYGQYPDLSDDDDDDQVFTEHLSLPHDPLSLPNIRQVPLSAPPVRLHQPQSSSNQSTVKPKRSNSFKTEHGLSRTNSERRKSDIKKQNRSLERNSKPNSSSSLRAPVKSRRSRSQSGSPPYGRLPVSLPPIERPKTMGSQVSARSGGSRTRETNNKPRSGKNEVQFSVSGVGLRHQDERKSGVNSRISMNGPLHWDLGGRKTSGVSCKPRTHDKVDSGVVMSSANNNRVTSASKPRKLKPIKI